MNWASDDLCNKYSNKGRKEVDMVHYEGAYVVGWVRVRMRVCLRACVTKNVTRAGHLELSLKLNTPSKEVGEGNSTGSTRTWRSG